MITLYCKGSWIHDVFRLLDSWTSTMSRMVWHKQLSRLSNKNRGYRKRQSCMDMQHSNDPISLRNYTCVRLDGTWYVMMAMIQRNYVHCISIVLQQVAKHQNHHGPSHIQWKFRCCTLRLLVLPKHSVEGPHPRDKPTTAAVVDEPGPVDDAGFTETVDASEMFGLNLKTHQHR